MSELRSASVSGDVGNGKTEVAMRAAFHATLDRKQVLVPTTVLAEQHFRSFKRRCLFVTSRVAGNCIRSELSSFDSAVSTRGAAGSSRAQ